MFTADKLAQGEGCVDRVELLAIRDILLIDLESERWDARKEPTISNSLREIFELQQKYEDQPI